ncbi:MAG TPA: NAD(P)-binding domain-containing protein [Kofleriaceae bacterium]
MRHAAYDLLVVGAGPAGLATAIEAQHRGLRVVVIDRGTVVEHIRHFPIGMAFYTPRSTLELAGLPLDVPRRHPTREDVLSYYARVARIAGLEVRTGRALGAVTGSDGAFTAAVGEPAELIRARKIVIATGVFGQPHRLDGVPGLDLPKVSYGYQDPHAFFGLDVVIAGAGNSAAEAAQRFFHAGARVTVLDRGATIAATKWRWRLQDIAELEQTGAIRVMHRARLSRIEPAHVVIETPEGEVTLPNDRVVLLLGFEPSREIFDRLGIAYDPVTLAPRVDPRSLEASVPGIYLAGIVLAGRSPDRVFIRGARHHGKSIVAHITGEPMPPIEDRGTGTAVHWRQFEELDEVLDAELALDLVPVVVGELRDDLVDVHVYKALKAGRAVHESHEPLGSVIDAMEGWLFERDPDGTGVLHGRPLSRDALDLLRRADGTRRVRDIVAELAEEVDQPLDDVRTMVVSAFLALLRGGTITWRVPQRSGR